MLPPYYNWWHPFAASIIKLLTVPGTLGWFHYIIWRIPLYYCWQCMTPLGCFYKTVYVIVGSAWHPWLLLLYNCWQCLTPLGCFFYIIVDSALHPWLILLYNFSQWWWGGGGGGGRVPWNFTPHWVGNVKICLVNLRRFLASSSWGGILGT